MTATAAPRAECPIPQIGSRWEAVETRIGKIGRAVATQATAIRNGIAIYRDETVVPTALLEASIRGNTERAMNYLEFGGEIDSSVARRNGVDRAVQGAPMVDVLRAYRIGFQCFWEWLLTVARERDEREAAALIGAVTDIWTMSDEFATAMTEGYREETTRRAVAADRRRSALVAGLLDGTLGTEHTTWEIGQLLDMPFEGAFLVVVAEAPPIGDERCRISRTDYGFETSSRPGDHIPIAMWAWCTATAATATTPCSN